MDIERLEQTARQMVREGHGILAADDSMKSSLKRFTDAGLPHTEESRRDYRYLLASSAKAAEVLSGMILFEETFNQSTPDGVPFPQYLDGRGILPGIKLDQGLQDLPGFPGEKITAGLDALPERAKDFAAKGARFAKWRNVIAIGENIPTEECIGSNTYILARYARICQDNGIVPIIEPEMVFDGTHSSQRCEEVTAHVYDLLFQTCRAFRVHLPGAVMKTSMVLPGKQGEERMDANVVAERTVRVLHDHVPAELGGVVFLSGGQTQGQSFINLNRIEQKAIGTLPFNVTFSYMRGLQDSTLHYSGAHPGDTAGARALFDGLLEKIADAREGRLDESGFSMDPEGEMKAEGIREY